MSMTLRKCAGQRGLALEAEFAAQSWVDSCRELREGGWLDEIQSTIWAKGSLGLIRIQWTVSLG